MKALILSACLFPCFLTGCATITTGTSQAILVDTSPQGATCRFSRENKEVGVVNPTPGMLMISKSIYPMSVICTKEGYVPGTGGIQSRHQPMGWGNILLGGVVGIAVDAASGAQAIYDTSIKVDLRKIQSANLDRVIYDLKQQP